MPIMDLYYTLAIKTSQKGRLFVILNFKFTFFEGEIFILIYIFRVLLLVSRSHEFSWIAGYLA